MKKIILTLFGICFVILTGCSLLICMLSGIPTFDQPAATFYLVKAILLSFGFPLVTAFFFARNLQLRKNIAKKNQLFQNILKELAMEHQPSCRDSQEPDSRNFKDSLTCLLCAFAEEKTLDKDEQKELLDFIDKF